MPGFYPYMRNHLPLASRWVVTVTANLRVDNIKTRLTSKVLEILRVGM